MTGGTYTIGADPIPILPHLVGPNLEPCTALEVGTAACRATYAPGPRNDWAPKHQVWLSPFFIDTFEVTNGRYKECVTAGACTSAGGAALNDPLVANSPVVSVTWRQANDYCRWREKRLPTEAGWESAARGKKAFQWVWGDTPQRGMRQLFPAGTVGSNAEDISPFGVHDMQWSVAEWVNDWYGGPYSDDGRLVRNPQGPVGAQTGLIKCCRNDAWRRMFSWDGDKVFRGTPFAGPGGRELEGLAQDFPLWVRAYDEGMWDVLGFRCARDGRTETTAQALQSIPTHRDLSWKWYGKRSAP